MTDHIGARGPEFRVGSVIGRAVSVYFGNIVPILIISLIAYLPLIVLTVLFASSASNFEAMAQGQVPMGAAEIVGLVLLVLAAVVGWNWLSAGVTYGVIAALRQGRINLGEALGTSLRAVLPLIGLGAGMGSWSANTEERNKATFAAMCQEAKLSNPNLVCVYNGSNS